MNKIKRISIMKKYIWLILFGIILAVGIWAVYYFDLASVFSLDNIPVLQEKFLSLGHWAFLVYFVTYVLVCLFFLPGLPITILGGALFGPVWGTIYTVISASVGLSLSFLASRYAIRRIMLDKFGNSDAFKKIDAGVKNEGWRILMITRLVPIFPFSIQNYIYGLTDINFFLYWGLSTLFIIPGSAAYTMSIGAVLAGDFSSKNLIYLGLGALCFVFVSLIPKLIQKKPKSSEEKSTH